MEKKAFDELHAKIRKSMVRIRTVRPDNAIAIFPGTIILSSDKFCYIIAHNYAFCGGPNTKYEVILPDSQGSQGSIIELDATDVKINKSIAIFSILNEFHDKIVQAVDFSGDQVLANEEVYTLCFHERAILPSFLANGRINYADQYQFIHDCSGHLFAAYGSPVFNGNGFFAGINYNECGALVALNTESVKKTLWVVYPEVKNQELHDVLLSLKAKAEALQRVS